MKDSKVIAVMLVVFMLLLMTIGVLFMVRPGVIDNRRAAKEAEIIAMIEASGGSVEIPDMQLPEVQGEEDETFEGYEPGFEQDMGSIPGYEPEEGAEESKSVGRGTISIPAIDLKMAVMEGADRRALRGGAGWLPSSAEMGAPGNCVIFGHRMKKYGRHFNRLDEMEAGDEINLSAGDGDVYTYTVTGKETIEPEELFNALSSHNDGYSLTLVTCTPVGKGTHRLLIYAAMQP